MKRLILSHFVFFISYSLFSQNIGIGTTTPQAKLDINGDLKLQNGSSVNKFSRDSSFAANSHNNVPTEKAIKDYLQKGFWVPTDISNPGPNAPVPGSTTSTNISNPYSVFVQGNYAYVASSSPGSLSIYDISNPDNIVAKGTISTNLAVAASVFVQGNYAYVSSWSNNRLCIFDISNPDLIVAKGYISAGLNQPYTVFVQGNYAYVASYGNGLIFIFDVSNPNAILYINSFNALTLSESVYVRGNYAYVAGQSLLAVFNISNPASVTLAGYNYTNLSGPCRSVFVAGNYAYVTSTNNSSLVIFDIADPANIIPKGTSNTNLYLPTSVYVQGNYAFVTSNGNNVLSLFDVSDPNNIIAKGSNSQNLNYPVSVFVQGNYAYVASYNNNRFCIFDLDRSRTLLMTPAGISATSLLWKETGSNIYRAAGNVGIGTSIPTEKLSVNGNISTTGQLTMGATTGDKIALWGSISDPHYGFSISSYQLRIHTDQAAADVVFGYGNQAVFTETMRIKGDGNAILTGILTQNSDARLKKNFHVLDGSLEKLIRLNGYHYQWINVNSDQSIQTGLIAQEVQKLFPELVKENNGTLSVNYTGLIPVMIESIKELKQQIEELKLLFQKSVKDTKL